MTIGIMLVNSMGGAVGEMKVAAIEQAACLKEYCCYLAHHRPKMDEVETLDVLRDLVDRRTDGLITLSYSGISQDMLDVLKTRGVPCVFYDGPNQCANAVHIIRQGAIQQVAEHLVQLGHRRVGLFMGWFPHQKQSGIGVQCSKANEYRQVLRKADLELVWDRGWLMDAQSPGVLNLKEAYQVILTVRRQHPRSANSY